MYKNIARKADVPFRDPDVQRRLLGEGFHSAWDEPEDHKPYPMAGTLQRKLRREHAEEIKRRKAEIAASAGQPRLTLHEGYIQKGQWQREWKDEPGENPMSIFGSNPPTYVDVSNRFPLRRRFAAMRNRKTSKWIQKAKPKKGALRDQLKRLGKLKGDGPIPVKVLKWAVKKGGILAKRAQLAMTLRKVKHKKNIGRISKPGKKNPPQVSMYPTSKGWIVAYRTGRMSRPVKIKFKTRHAAVAAAANLRGGRHGGALRFKTRSNSYKRKSSRKKRYYTPKSRTASKVYAGLKAAGVKIKKRYSRSRSKSKASLQKIYGKTLEIRATASVNSSTPEGRAAGVRKSTRFYHKFTSKPAIYGVKKSGMYRLPAGALVIKGRKKLFRHYGPKSGSAGGY